MQIIALVIGFGSLGAAIVDQQLNMAAEGMGGEDSIGKFLAQVRFYVSAAALVIQVWITPRIHRYLGIGFALLMLPTTLAVTATAIILTGVPWAAAIARISDQSLRYSVDKTTREVLFLPLPSELRQEVKPLVDVTVDRVSRGLGAILLVILIQPWGLHFGWQQLSFVSLGLTVLWYFNAFRAKREYLKAFRQSLERRDVQPEGLRLGGADLSTVEALMEELANPDEHRVLYAIEILESLEKRNLITPLLLFHDSRAVRARVLQALGNVKPEIAERWLPSIQRMIADESPEVRAAAISALANIRNERVTDLIRPYLQDADPRIVTTAAGVLARSGREEDVAASVEVLTRLASDTRESAAEARKDVAVAIRQIPDPRFRQILIPLLYDSHPEVAAEAMRSVRALGASDPLFVPTLVSLLRHRSLKSSARDALVGYGEGVLDTLAYLLRDPGEDIWVRRHIPATIARIPAQKSVDILIEALQDPDSFLRYKAVTGLEKLHRDHPELTIDRQPIEALASKEALSYFNYLTLHYNLFDRGKLSADGLLAGALQEKMARAVDRVYRLLGLIYPWKDIGAARYAIEHGDATVARQRPRVRRQPSHSAASQAPDAARGRRADRREGAPGERRAQDATARCRRNAAAAHQRRRPNCGRGGDRSRRGAEALDPGERYRVRARAPGRERLVRVRSRLLGTRSVPPPGEQAPQPLDRAAARGAACGTPAPHAGVRVGLGRRAVPNRRKRAPDPVRERTHPLSGRSRSRAASVHARRHGDREGRRRGCAQHRPTRVARIRTDPRRPRDA